MPHTLPIADLLMLAAWGDIIGYLVVIVFVVLRYLLSELGENKQKPQRPRPARPPQVGPDQRPQPAGPPQDDLRSEVDEFLRRAKGLPPREEAEERKPPRQLEPAVEPIIIESNRPEPRSRELRRPAQPPATAPGPDPYRGDSVGEHVSQHLRHLKESQLAENAARLGEELGQTDEKLEARLKAKFEHRLGKLQHRDEEPTLEEADPLDSVLAADQIAAMLANPEGVRNAVILNEILKRPVDRW